MRKMGKLLRRLLLLMLIAAIAGAAYMYLAPLLRPQEVTVYEAYTVTRGDIATENSFSASISIASSEKHSNTSRATAIREIYVTNGQTVKKGDKLMMLDNGEVLKAGLDGVVTEMRFDTSDWLWNNVDLIQISDLTNLKVSLSVDEYDVRNVAAGQTCYVTIVPTGEVFETVISHVDRVSSSSGQVAYYTANAELTVPDSVLPGMTASVTIPSDRADDVLLLDMGALAFDEEKQPYVLKQNETGYEKVPVTTGLSDGMQVEIVAGLQEGDVVWAVAGTETTQFSFSISDLYKELVGVKVVINDKSGNSQNNRNGFSNEGFDFGGSSGRPSSTDGAEAAEGEDAKPTQQPGEGFDFGGSSGRPSSTEGAEPADGEETKPTRQPGEGFDFGGSSGRPSSKPDHERETENEDTNPAEEKRDMPQQREQERTE